MSKYNVLVSLLPQGNSVSYNDFLEIFPGLKEQKETPQDLIYHGEGDVWTHTKMVCDALISQSYYKSASEDQKFIMFYAALLHDLGKPACTKEDAGRITSVGHSKRGAIDVRIDLWKKEIPFHLREAIVNIIGCHQVPFFAFAQKQKIGSNYPVRTPEYLAHELSWQMPLDLLINVAKADMLGRIFADKQKSMDDIELFEELAREQKCLYGSKEFPTLNTRMKYFNSGGAISPDYEFYAETGSEVIVLSGLPASGKNTWVEKNAKDLPVLSFDDAKDLLGLKQGDNVGTAVHMVINKAKEFLRRKESFIWNATHLSKQMRDKTLSLLYNYEAKVKLVYLEAPEYEIKKRNTLRDTTLPNSKIDEMLFKWEVPTPIESHEIIYEPLHLVKEKKMKI